MRSQLERLACFAILLLCLGPDLLVATPRLVRNINETNAGLGSDPRSVVVGDAVIMLVRGGPALEIWRTDGSAPGTTRLATGVLDTSDLQRAIVVATEDEAFFAHPFSRGLWRTDGTQSGTHRLLTNLTIKGLVPLPNGDRVVFVEGDDRVLRLSVLDLADETVEVLATVLEPSSDFATVQVGAIGSRALIGLSVLNEPLAGSLWASDGTAEGTERLVEGNALAAPVVVGDLVTLFSSTGDRVRVWRSDGTVAGTRAIGDTTGGTRGVSQTAVVGQRVLFLTTSGGLSELRLFSVDPVDETLALLAQVAPNGFYVANSLHALGNRALFASASGDAGLEPWVSDGTPDGTRRLADLCPGSCSSDLTLGRPGGVARLGDRLLFAADDGAGVSVWSTNGFDEPARFIDACAACVQTRDIALLSLDDQRVLVRTPEALQISETDGGTSTIVQQRLFVSFVDTARLAGRVIFGASTISDGSEPWVSDGTAAGTGLILDLRDNDAGSQPSLVGDFGKEALLFAIDGVSGRRFWRSDGTLDGTTPVGSGDGLEPWNGAQGLRVAGNQVFFVATTEEGRALWSTPDLDAPPQRLTPFLPEPKSGPFPTEPVLISLAVSATNGERVIFFRESGVWSSDGTVEGTVRLTPHDLVVEFQHLLDMRTVGTLTAFLLGEASGNQTLWATDGSPAGTAPVRAGDGTVLDQIFSVGPSLGDRLAVTRSTSSGQSLWLALGDDVATRLLGPADETITPLAATSAARKEGERLLVSRGTFERTALWGVDAAGNAELLVPEGPGRFGVIPELLDRDAPSKFRFATNRDALGLGGWFTDGTAAGTQFIVAPALPPVVVQFGSRLLFHTRDRQLVAIVLPSGNREILADDLGLAFVTGGRIIDGVAVFTAESSTFGDSLWRTDGRWQGTFPLTASSLEPFLTNPRQPLPVGDDIFLVGSRSDVGQELWALPRSDLEAPVLALRADDRFRIRVRWQKPDGESGFGMPDRLTSDTGSFWFFRESNLELMVKVLDGRSDNGHFWVFYGALSNVEYTITVTDRETGAVKVYENPAGSFASVGDTRAFAVPGTNSIEIDPVAELAAAVDGLASLTTGNRLAPIEERSNPGGCVNTDEALCLQQSRFALSVEWEKPNGEMGKGTAVPLTADTGTFWFFRDTNVELIVKVLDGRSNNGHFWVFYGALSNVKYTLTVTDTATGGVRIYENPPGAFASVGDTSAFAVP